MVDIAVAATSARVMAESAAESGLSVTALDVFGDRDTRRAAAQWQPIGTPELLRIDGESLLRALHGLARGGAASGWVAGSGFEALPALLDEGAAVLPLIGTAPAHQRRVRDPAMFFAFLDSAQIAHPRVCMAPPVDTAGWLVKSSQGTGGWHIREADQPAHHTLPPHEYFQRRVPGVPMSATFIANGGDALVLGCNELIVRSFGARPFVYCGAIGPAPASAEVAHQVHRTVRLLAAEFSLRGLGSLDFMLHDKTINVLEVNPRPSASMDLYRRHVPQGLMAAHLRACLHSELPRLGTAPPGTRGTETVFARKRLVLSDAASAWLAQQPQCHDLPPAGAVFDAGNPLCSTSTMGATPTELRTQLHERREALLNTLEAWT